MLSLVTLRRPSAPLSAGLRCQLREVLLRTRTRPFSTTRNRCQTDSEYSESFLNHRKAAGDNLELKHARLRLPGRVVGRPGKRQRVVAERLSTDSLNKPSNVIIFHDLNQEPNLPPQPPTYDAHAEKAPALRALSEEDVRGIEDAVLGRDLVPGEAEVNASIDELKPHETEVKREEFEHYRRALSRGYTFRQLSRYLAWSTSSPTASAPGFDPAVDGLIVSEWRPGLSDLILRHPAIVRSPPADTKAKTIERILRLVWQLKIASEGQDSREGELEIQLQHWQMVMLCDLIHNGKPYYEQLVSPQVLLDSARVEAHRSDNVLRITARRENAEEIARQLRTTLLGVQPLELDLNALQSLLPLSNKRTSGSKLINDEDLRYVSHTTHSVVIEEDTNIMTIYAVTPSRSHSARCLLLSLLDIPPPVSYHGFSDVAASMSHTEQRAEKIKLALPLDLPEAGLHRRHRNSRLYRSVVPSEHQHHANSPDVQSGSTGNNLRTNMVQAETKFTDTGQALVEALRSVSEPNVANRTLAGQHSSYWRDTSRLSDWKAEYCKLVHSVVEPSVVSPPARIVHTPSGGTSGIVQSQVPGAETLLTFYSSAQLPQPLNSADNGQPQRNDFTKSPFDRRMPYLVSHFIPSSSATKLYKQPPRIEMRFRFSAPQVLSQHRELSLVGIKAILDKQFLDVPNPHCTVDLQFSRELSVISNVTLAMQDDDIRDFWEKLQHSVESGVGALVAPPKLNFKLPRWMLSVADTATQDVLDVEYIFERFQQVQKLHFTPTQDTRVMQELRPEARAMIESFPEQYHLVYDEAEGGAIHGSKTSLTLCRRKTERSAPITSEQEAVAELIGLAPKPTTGGGKPDDDKSELSEFDTYTRQRQPESEPGLLFTTTALQVAHLLTDANAGSLRLAQTGK